MNGAAPRSREIVSTSYDAGNDDRSIVRIYLDRRRIRLHFIPNFLLIEGVLCCSFLLGNYTTKIIDGTRIIFCCCGHKNLQFFRCR